MHFPQQHRPVAAPPCWLVAFGDSITWGAYASVPTVAAYIPLQPVSAHVVRVGDTTYPGDLGRLVHRSICNYGVPGEMVQQGRLRLHELLKGYRPKLLIVLEGVNDLPVPRSSGQIVGDLAAMLKEAHRKHVPAILTTLTPTYYSTSSPKHYLNAAVRAVNVRIRRWARAHHARLADLERAFVRDGRGRKLTADLLHPNDVGYRLVARTIARAMPRGAG